VACAAYYASLHFIAWPTAAPALSLWPGAVITAPRGGQGKRAGSVVWGHRLPLPSPSDGPEGIWAQTEGICIGQQHFAQV